jgi:sugar lactone lactonase YvrE
LSPTAKLVDVIEAQDCLGEGPLWNVGDQRLWWTDIHNRRLRRWGLGAGAIEDVATPERLCSFALVEGRPDRLLAAFETGLAWFTPGTGAVEWIARPEAGGTGRRFNDGRTDRAGRFWVGSMVEDEARAPPASASLWRFDGVGRFVACESGVSIANSLASSPDGRTLYFADTPRRAIYAYDLDPETGAISGKRLFAEVERGFPDGATVDAEGRLWSARWGGGEVVCHDPDGREALVVEVSASQPTCVAFGGSDLSLMFVTSATEGLTAKALEGSPLAGSVFVYETDAVGLAEVPYRIATV